MRRHAIFDELDASLEGTVQREPVAFAGQWLPSARRTYENARQSGTGLGPFVDVVDLRWRGTLAFSLPIGGIAFLATTDRVFWVKSLPAMPTLALDVSLHAYADHLPERATFVAGMGGAALPGIRIECGRDLIGGCALRGSNLTTAKVEPIAEVSAATFAVLLIQGRFLEVGRRRLWRVREGLASAFPPRVREILTRRRCGTIGGEWESSPH